MVTLCVIPFYTGWRFSIFTGVATGINLQNKKIGNSRMERGERDNIVGTVKWFLDELDRIKDPRQNINDREKNRLQNKIVSGLFEYLKAQPKFISIYPKFRASVHKRGEEFLQAPSLSEETKRTIYDYLTILVNELPLREDYIAGGGSRRRRKTRKINKKSKSRRRSRN